MLLNLRQDGTSNVIAMLAESGDDDDDDDDDDDGGRGSGIGISTSSVHHETA